MSHHCIYILKTLVITKIEKTKNGENPNYLHITLGNE
jgi:hypothetical protein